MFPNLTHTETGDPLRKGQRQSGYSCVSFSAYSQFTDNLLLHIGYSPQAQHKGELPEGREKPHWGAARATHLHIASPQGQSPIFYSQLLLRIQKSTAFAVLSVCR